MFNNKKMAQEAMKQMVTQVLVKKVAKEMNCPTDIPKVHNLITLIDNKLGFGSPEEYDALFELQSESFIEKMKDCPYASYILETAYEKELFEHSLDENAIGFISFEKLLKTYKEYYDRIKPYMMTKVEIANAFEAMKNSPADFLEKILKDMNLIK